MFIASNTVLDDLRAVIASLGDDGGSISPSVYDTAQLLRFAPPQGGVEPALAWLIGQQHPDGGWGEPSAPAARVVSSLAAILTIHTYDPSAPARETVRAGVEFLHQQAAQWADLHVDAMPVAVEMILPMLLDDARKAGLNIDSTPYAGIFELQRKKRQLLVKEELKPNTAPTFSWEALRQPFQPVVLDPIFGVGHSPAATAAWLAAGREMGADSALLAKAEDYLARAEASTRTGIPGVVPVAYPIVGIELSYGLYPLLLTGILNLPALQDVVQPKLKQLQAILEQNKGLGFGKTFVADVDDTGVAMAVLYAANRDVDIELLRQFWNNDHFYTYGHEINPSVISNAHALHALARHGKSCDATEKFLLARQQPEGHWLPDKWQTSWRCITMEAVSALVHFGNGNALQAACRALIADQNSDGSWGIDGSPSFLETVYGIIALRQAAGSVQCDDSERSLARAEQWLATHYIDFGDSELRWMCKEVFSLVTVDRAYLLSTIVTAEGYGLRMPATVIKQNAPIAAG